MKNEDKVVSRTIAKILAQAGWKDYTAWTWMKFTDEWRLIPSYDVESYAETRKRHRMSSTHYPAPDVSELLEALQGYPVRLHVISDPDEGCYAEITFALGEGLDFGVQGDTLTDTLAQLWCELKSKEAQ